MEPSPRNRGDRGFPRPDLTLLFDCGLGMGRGETPFEANARALGVDPDELDCLVVSHLHADHAGGLSGVSDGRTVGEVEIGSSSTPAEQFRGVLQTA